MLYIIDANNLAGKLGLLEEDNFDKILASRFETAFGGSGNEIVLVFDSNDPMGDRFREGNIEIVYTPRDDFYCGADDKVLELIRSHLADQGFKKEIRVVTDDSGLKEKIRSAMADSANGWRVEIILASDFSVRLGASDQAADEKAAAASDEKLQEELLRAWKK